LIPNLPDINTSLKAVSARLKHLLLLSLRVSVLVISITEVSAQSGPGGVGSSVNNLLWLKADAGTSTLVNGAPVVSWLDQSGNAMNATQPVANLQPKYVSVSSTGHPALLLNNQSDATYDYLLLPGGFSNFSAGFSAYVVVKPNSVTPWSNFFNLGGGAVNLWDEAISFSRDNSTANLRYDVVTGGVETPMSGASITPAAYQILSVRQNAGAAPATAQSRLYRNSTLIAGPVALNSPGNFVRTDNYIGHNSWGAGDIDAEFAEVIIYNFLVNSAQRIIISNYLSSKYGIALPLTSDKYPYDGAVGYGNDVAGIGRVDASNFHDNATSAGILNISNPSALDNADYFLFGHNNGAITSWTSANAPTDILNMSVQRVARTWRAARTGDVGTVAITGDFTSLPSIAPGYTIRALFVDSDGDFTSGAIEYPLTDIGSNKFQISGVALNEGDYLTFAVCKINNEDACNALPLNIGAACTFQLFSNEGASDSGVPDPGNCDGTGASGYAGGDVWFQVVVPASGSFILNTATQSASPANLEWANRIGLAVYSGTCGSLTKIDCQISPLSQNPAGDVNLTVSGQTPGVTLFIRMWEWGNNDNGKFRLCAYDHCLQPPVITGSIAPTGIEGCLVGSAPDAETTVAGLESLGLTISDVCTPKASLTIDHSDSFISTCPIVLTRRYTITNSSGISSSYDQIFNINDTQAPVITGSPLITYIEACTIGSLPAAFTTVAEIAALPGITSIIDGCTSSATLTVDNSQTMVTPCPIRVTRIYTITDACGNKSEVTHVIEVSDTQPPVVSGALLPVSVEGCGPASAPAAVTNAIALEALPGNLTLTDGCTATAGLVVTHADVVQNGCPVIITRTYSIHDACLNSVDVIQTITVTDTQGPVITGSLTAADVEGCSSADAPAAAANVAELEALPGAILVDDACTADPSLIVTFADASSGACPVVVTRTYTITDACGNSSTVVHTINIHDTQSPIITGSLADVQAEGCGSADAPPAETTLAGLEALAGNLAVSDGCTAPASLIITYSDSGSGICPTIVTRTYTIADGCGNSSQTIQKITITNIQGPVVTGTLDPVIIEACGVSAAPVAETTVAGLQSLTGGITVIDACTAGPALVVSHSDDLTGQCPRTITRTYHVKDGCGNSVDIIQSISIDDTQPPVVTGSLPPLSAEGCTASSAPPAETNLAGLLALGGTLAVTDNCTPGVSIVVTSTDVPSGTCPVTITRTYVIADICGNPSTTVQTVYVQDTTPPVITGTLLPVNIEGCGIGAIAAPENTLAGLLALPGGLAVSDGCSPANSLVVTSSDSTGGSCPFVLARTYTITDNCGNASTVVQRTYVDDTQPPQVTGSLTPLSIEGCGTEDAPAPALTIAELEALPGSIIVLDACTAAAGLIITSADAVSGQCPETITRTYEITDVCGNSINVVQIINIDDTQAPDITGALTPVTVEGCNAADVPLPVTTVADLEALPGGISVSDGCTLPGALVVTSSDSSTGSCPVVVTRTYTITDNCGNFATVDQTINVADTHAPVVTGALSDVTVEGCSQSAAPAAVTSVSALEALPGGLTVTDTCTPGNLLTVTSSDAVSGSCPIVITRSYTITDQCTNFVNVVQLINIRDTNAPVVTGSLQTVNIEGCGTADAPAAVTTVAGLEALPGGITIADACTPGAALTVSSSDAPAGSCPTIISRTYRIADQCGNFTDLIQTLSIDDTTPPAFTVPADLTIFKNASCGYDASVAITGDVTDESDNCSAGLDATFADGGSTGSCQGEMIITRTWSLTDNCGNTTTHIQTITVKDNTPPSFTVPANITIYKNSSCGYNALPSITGDVTDEADNCTNALNATYSDLVANGLCEGEQIITRTWSLTDDCGNNTSAIQIITVSDITPPQFTVPPDVHVCRKADCSFDISTAITGDVTDEGDNCSTGLQAVYIDDLTGAVDCNGAGIVLRIWSLTDKCGNAADDQVQTIFVDPLPSISVTANDALLCHTGQSVVFTVGTTNTITPGSLWKYDVSVAYPAGVTGSWSAGLTNQTAVTLTDNPVSSSDIVQTITYTFSPHITPPGGGADCGNGTPVTIIIYIDPRPKISVTADEVVCYDGVSTFTIGTVNTSLHPGSTWRYDVSVSYPAGVTGSLSSGLTDQTGLTLSDPLSNSTNTVHTVIYTFTPHIQPGDGGAECLNGLPVTISVDIDPLPKIAVVTDQLLCYDGDAVFDVSTVNSPLHAGSIWSYDVSVTYPAGVTGSWPSGLTSQTALHLTDDLLNITSSVQTVTYIFTPHINPGDGGPECGGALPLTVSVDIEPRPALSVVNDQLLCHDGDAVFNITDLNPALHAGSIWRYDISVSYPAGVTGSWNGGLTDQTGSVMTDDLTNATNTVQTVTYVFTPHIMPGDGGTECNGGLPVTVHVNIDPQPKITVTTDQLLCYDGNAVFNISTVNSSLYTGSVWRYDVSVSYPAGVTGTWASGLTDQAAATLTDNLTNTSDVVQSVTYTFTPHIKPGDGGTECAGGVPVVITIDIDPQPMINVTTDPLLCYDGNAVFNISTVNIPVHPGSLWRYDVAVSYPAGVTGSWSSGLTNQTASTLTDDLTNNTTLVQNVTYTFTPHIKPGDSGTECAGDVPFNITVNLDPRPRITVTADQLLCFDGNAVFTISTVNSSLHPGSLWRYDVSVAYPAGVTGTLAPGLTDQTAGSLTDDLTNTTDVVQTVTYTFTPHIQPGDGGTECAGGVPVVISVDLDPQPKINVTGDLLLCYDGNAVFSISTVNKLHSGSLWWYDVAVSYPAGVTGTLTGGLINQTATTLTDDLTNTTDIVQTVTYIFTPHVAPADGESECANGIAVTMTVDLDPQPKISVITDTLLCYDGNAIFNINTVNSPLHTGSLWQYDVSVTYPAGVTGSWSSGLSNQTALTLTDDLTNNTDFVQTVKYVFTPHIKPGDGGTECGKGLPVTLTVDLDPKPKITVTTDPLLCFDGDATFFVGTANAKLHTGSTWLYNVAVTYPAGVTGSWPAGLTDQSAYFITDNLTNTTNTVQTITYSFTPHIRPGDGGSECAGGSVVVLSVNLDPQPRITAPVPQPVCFDGTASLNISTVNTPLYSGSIWRYDVTAAYPAGVTGTLGSGLINQTGSVLNDKLTNTTDIVQSVAYTLTPHIKPGDGGTECLNGIPLIVNILVNPQPRLFPVPPASVQCDSTLTNIVLQSPSIFTSGVITFDQTVSGDGSVKGFTSPVTGLPNNNVIAERLINTTDAYHTVTYTIVPVSPTGCASGVPVSISVTVNPTPRALPLNPNLKRDSSICTGGNTRVVLTSPTVMTSGAMRFDYSVSLSGGPGVISGNTTAQNTMIPGYAITYPYINSSDTIQSVYYHVTPKVSNAMCKPGPVVTSEVKVHAKSLQKMEVIKPLTCDGGSDAAIRATPSKGAGQYYYDWVRNSTDQVHGFGITDIINRKGGRWDVKVTDNLGCSASDYVFVEGAFLDSYMYVVDTSGFGTTCKNSNDGEIWIYEKISSTGVAPFEYWVVRNGQDTVIHSTLTNVGMPQQKWYNQLPGSYKLFIRDSNGCYNLNYPVAIITEPDSVQVTLNESKYSGGFNVTCKGYNDGSVSVAGSPTGGNGDYRFKWFTYDGLITGPDTLNRIDNLIAGTYYLRTTDRKGCTSLDSVRLNEPDGMTLAGSDVHHANDGAFNISCNGGSDGSIYLTISGGSGNYTYSWTGPGTFAATTRDITGLRAGIYKLTARDVNGCILMPQPEFNLTEPPPLSVTGVSSVSPDGAYNISCSGGPGLIDVTVTGGITGSYIYTWTTTNGSGIVPGQEDQDSLTAGSYNLKVTDQNLCESSLNISLTQPTAINLNFAVTNITCQAPAFDNGAVDLTITGGITPYSQIWSDGSSTEDLTGLTNGYYTVSVTDANGCLKKDSAMVSLPPPVTFNKVISDYNNYQITCFGKSDGSISIEPTNGALPYIYSWTGPDGFTSGSNEITGLKAGAYILNIIDKDFCTATDTFQLKQPQQIGMTILLSQSIAGGFNINCADEKSGTIDIEPVNAAGLVTFAWSDGAGGQTRSGLGAGTYRVIMTDGNNCPLDSTITLTQPEPLYFTYRIVRPFCPDMNDGQIAVDSVRGGVSAGSYSYLWSNGSTSPELLSIHSDRYSVSVSDLNGCTLTKDVKVTPVNDICLVIPEAFSPNGDLVNDYWNIGLIDLYPEAEITIFNRWGEQLWKSARGYPDPWDGKSGGKKVAMDSYHYIIELHNGSKLIIGNVTVVR
jgi:gliding motility-associated-like protein